MANMVNIAEIEAVEGSIKPQLALQNLCNGDDKILLNEFKCSLSLHFSNGKIFIEKVPLIYLSISLDYAIFTATVGNREGVVFAEDQRRFSLKPTVDDAEFIISAPVLGQRQDLCFSVRAAEISRAMREIVQEIRAMFRDVQHMKWEAYQALPHNIILRHIFEE